MILAQPLSFYGETNVRVKLGDEGMIVSSHGGTEVKGVNCRELEYCSP